MMNNQIPTELKNQCIQLLNAGIPIGWIPWFTYDRKVGITNYLNETKEARKETK